MLASSVRPRPNLITLSTIFTRSFLVQCKVPEAGQRRPGVLIVDQTIIALVPNDASIFFSIRL